MSEPITFEQTTAALKLYGLTLEEWDALRAPVRARLLDLMRTRNELVDGLNGARAALMCYWHHSPTKIEAEIERIDARLAKEAS